MNQFFISAKLVLDSASFIPSRIKNKYIDKYICYKNNLYLQQNKLIIKSTHPFIIPVDVVLAHINPYLYPNDIINLFLSSKSLFAFSHNCVSNLDIVIHNFNHHLLYFPKLLRNIQYHGPNNSIVSHIISNYVRKLTLVDKNKLAISSIVNIVEPKYLRIVNSYLTYISTDKSMEQLSILELFNTNINEFSCLDKLKKLSVLTYYTDIPYTKLVLLKNISPNLSSIVICGVISISIVLPDSIREIIIINSDIQYITSYSSVISSVVLFNSSGSHNIHLPNFLGSIVNNNVTTFISRNFISLQLFNSNIINDVLHHIYK